MSINSIIDMNLERYTFVTNTFFDYEFYSVGAKGKIKKVVRFSEILIGNDIAYNLSLADEHNKSQLLDDKITTNNGDGNLVLATVAGIILHFTSDRRKGFIYACGNTASRTRLYQFNIARMLEEINSLFVVFGLKDNDWKIFEKNVNYQAFMIYRI